MEDEEYLNLFSVFLCIYTCVFFLFQADTWGALTLNLTNLNMYLDLVDFKLHSILIYVEVNKEYPIKQIRNKANKDDRSLAL